MGKRVRFFHLLAIGFLLLDSCIRREEKVRPIGGIPCYLSISYVEWGKTNPSCSCDSLGINSVGVFTTHSKDTVERFIHYLSQAEANRRVHKEYTPYDSLCNPSICVEAGYDMDGFGLKLSPNDANSWAQLRLTPADSVRWFVTKIAYGEPK